MLSTFLAVTLLCADDPQCLIDVATKSKREHAALIPKLKTDLPRMKKELAAAKRARINPKVPGMERVGNIFVYHDQETKDKAIAALEASLDECTRRIEGKVVPVAGIPREPPRIGVAGSLGTFDARVKQITSPNTAIVELYYRIVRLRQARESAQATTDGYDKVSVTVWFEHDTSKWTDGTDISTIGPIVFHGTKTYETTGGASRTIPTVRLWTTEELQRFAELTQQK